MNHASLMIGIAMNVAVILGAGTAAAELTKTKLSASDFGAVEYKIRLQIDGIDAKASMDETMTKISEALDMCNVTTPASGPGRRG
jgi:hypothetical protein